MSGPVRAPAPRRGTFLMHQVWHDLLFAHWPFPPDEVSGLLPPGLRPHLDLYDGQAWIGVVPFHMSGIRPRGLPAVPGLSALPELNVRTYVTVGGQAGVYFFSLDAGSRMAVAAARRWYHLPYFNARMRVRHDEDTVRYTSQRTHRGAPPAELRAVYGPAGPPFHASTGSIDRWLTDRLCLFTVNLGVLYRVEIQHPPWPLQPAHATFEKNSMAAAASLTLPDQPPLLHFSRRLAMVARWPEVVDP